MTISTTDTPVLDLLASMTADSIEASSLDPETLVLVRIAALAAVDAPAVSYLLNLGAASDIGVEPDQIRGVLAAVAPIVGTARIASATGKIGKALNVAIEIAELEAEEDGGRGRPVGARPGTGTWHLKQPRTAFAAFAGLRGGGMLLRRVRVTRLGRASCRLAEDHIAPFG